MPHLTLNEVQSLRKLMCEDTEVNSVLQQCNFQHRDILFYCLRLIVPIRNLHQSGNIGRIKNISVFFVFPCSLSIAAIIASQICITRTSFQNDKIHGPSMSYK